MQNADAMQRESQLCDAKIRICRKRLSLTSTVVTTLPMPHAADCARCSQRHDRATLRSKRVDRRLFGDGIDRILFVLCERLVGVEVLVDNAAHAFLAVIAVGLRAVVPDGVRVLHRKGEDVWCFTRSGVEVETREDGVVAAERLAWLVKRGLHESVRLGEEVELHEIAGFCDYVFGLEM